MQDAVQKVTQVDKGVLVGVVFVVHINKLAIAIGNTQRLLALVVALDHVGLIRVRWTGVFDSVSDHWILGDARDRVHLWRRLGSFSRDLSLWN
jgi:hypothetical protein